MFHVGSTAVSLGRRDADRYRRYKQLYSTSAVQAEPSMRYWYHQNSFFDYVSLVLFPCSSEQNARLCENVFLQMWRPGLNYPQSNKLVFQSGAIKTTALMKKHVHDLMKKDGRGWNMQRSLGSSAWTHEHVYALYKLSANLEEPFRSSVRSRLASVLRFRKQDVPKRIQPPVFPFLAHSKFPAFLTQWLRTERDRFRSILLPFHLPSKTVVEGGHQSVGKLLFSFRKWFKKFEDHPRTSVCRCEDVLKYQHSLEVTAGRIASPADKLNMPAHLKKLVRFSVKSMVFPSKHVYLGHTSKMVEKWARLHKFPIQPVMEDWRRFVEEQWPTQRISWWRKTGSHLETSVASRDICNI